MPRAASRAQGGVDDPLHGFALVCRRESGRRRIGAHAACVRPRVAVEGALVVLRRQEGDCVLSVRKREEARLFAVEILLDDNLGSRASEAALEHHVDGAFRLVLRRSDDHALAGGQPVGLDDVRRIETRQIFLCPVGSCETSVGGGRNAGLVAQRLGEGLRGLDLGRGLRRPRTRVSAPPSARRPGPPRVALPVRRRPKSTFSRAQRAMTAAGSRGSTAKQPPSPARPGFPRRARQARQQGTLGDFPAQGVLAPA